MKPASLALVLAAAFAAPALANDTSAEMAAGGLVFVRNPSVEMRSEDLTISAKAIQVRYRFFNTAAADARVRVAFPMPDVTVSGPADLITIPTEDPENLLAFSTLVDGRPAPAAVEQKVMSKGVDRTALLRGLGVPLAPHLRATDKALDALPAAERDRLVKLGLAEVEEYDAGKGNERHWSARWTLKTTYHWEQVFPAGREIVIQHSYTPAVGVSAGTILGSKGQARSPETRAARAKYCVDDALTAALARARKPGEDFAPYYEQRIGYVLKTGANWKGPIGAFHLTIDKGAPENLVSFCADGVVKTGPARFEVRKTDFTPARDLSILILLPMPAQ